MTSLSVQQISFSSSGGAGRVAKNLHENLIERGHFSMFTHISQGDIRSVAFKYPKLFLAGSIDFFLVRKSRSQSLFSLFRNGSSLPTLNSRPQLIHLHWTPGMVSTLDIQEFSSLNYPMIWTIHDMFPFTGGCHHAMECEGFLSDCSNCPQVRPIFQNRVQAALTEKVERFRSNRPITVVSPSRWLGDKARKSKVFKESEVCVIPNPVDTSIFKPVEYLKITSGRKVTVGCNATNLLDPMKGVLTIIRVLETFQTINPEVEVELLAIGEGKLPISRIKIRRAGFIANQTEIVKLYQEMDIFVSMSLAESFPLSVAEAQSCGVPVICLNTGGMPEMIQPGVNGFVVNSSTELLQELNSFIKRNEGVASMRAASREHALSQYSTNTVVNQYIELYSQVLMK